METYCKPLRVVGFAGTEQSGQGVVTGNDEASQVGQQLTAEVENNKKEIEGGNANDSVDLRNRSLLLEVGEDGVFAQLRMRNQFWSIKDMRAKHKHTSRSSWERYCWARSCADIFRAWSKVYREVEECSR